MTIWITKAPEGIDVPLIQVLLTNHRYAELRDYCNDIGRLDPPPLEEWMRMLKLGRLQWSRDPHDWFDAMLNGRYLYDICPNLVIAADIRDCYYLVTGEGVVRSDLDTCREACETDHLQRSIEAVVEYIS
jgi:hypothetical protein